MTGVYRDTIMRLGVRVTETFHGETIWDGIVEVFEVQGHPKIPKVYAWLHEKGAGKRHVTVLLAGPNTSAVEAVRAAIIQEFRQRGEA